VSDVPIKIQAARQAITSAWPYLAQSAFRLTPRPVPPGAGLDFMAVDDRWNLYFNTQWVEEASVGQIALTIAAHELQHLLFRHHHRGHGHDPKKRNVCGDWAINGSLQEYCDTGTKYRQTAGKIAIDFTPGPDWAFAALAPPEIGGPFPEGLTMEDYLERWRDPPPRGGGSRPGKAVGVSAAQQPGADGVAGPGDVDGVPVRGCGSGSGNPGPYEVQGAAPTDVTEAEATLLQQATAMAIQQHMRTHGRGSVPGGLSEWAEFVLRPPKLRWQSVFRANVRKAVRWAEGQYDRTYTRRSRRQPARRHGRRIILPGYQAPVPPIVGILDTSGSMGPQDYVDGLSEFAGVVRQCGGQQGTPLLCCDADAYSVQMVKDPRRLLLTGFGGTDMGAGIAAAVKLGYKIMAVFTDGITPWGPPPPRDVKVVACLTQEPGDAWPVPPWVQSFVIAS
jgi:predicted metal-dependent peptidase